MPDEGSKMADEGPKMADDPPKTAQKTPRRGKVRGKLGIGSGSHNTTKYNRIQYNMKSGLPHRSPVANMLASSWLPKGISTDPRRHQDAEMQKVRAASGQRHPGAPAPLGEGG